MSEGAPVTLADGEVRHLNMTMRGFRTLTKRYGGLTKMMEALRSDPVDVTVAGFAVMLGIAETEVEGLMDYDRLQEYVDAFAGQLTRGMPGEARAPGTAPETTSTEGSSTSGSSPSDSAEPTSTA